MMTNPNAPPAAREPLRFACTCCGGNLEVPLALAGVSGPCPLCGGITAAPRLENGIRSTGAARLFAKPPPRRELPPPLAPVGETRPLLPTPVRPIPIVEEPPVAPPPPAIRTIIEAPVFAEQPFPEPEPSSAALPTAATLPAPAPAPEPVARPMRLSVLAPPPEPERLRAVMLAPLKLPEFTVPAPIPAPRGKNSLSERGIFDNSAAGDRSHILDIHPDIPMPRRYGWRRWVDIGLVSLFTGLLLATVAALRFTVPIEQSGAAALPSNLTQLVERETQNQALRSQEAGELACAAVNRYLGAASELAASSHLLPPPEGMAPPSFPPFLAPPSEWTVASSKRIPLTDRYLAIVQPKDAPAPMFVVEQTENGPRLHAGPVTQQSANLFDKFTATPGQGEATLYVELRPTVPGHERDYRAGRPDLDSYRFVDIQSGFPGDCKAFIACFKPESDAARHFARHGAHDLNWRRAVVHVRWQIHREAGPWVELEKFIPSPWSGDPPLTAASPEATAFTSP